MSEGIPPMEGPSGWDRVMDIYAHPSMEYDMVTRVARMSFLGGFFFGGTSTFALARQQYEQANVGRKYISASDAFKRRMDYGIVRFAKSGFGMGCKCAFISGSMIMMVTHVAAYRSRFSSLYFPAFSAVVGGVFTFPLGILGMVKAASLGVTSGLSLSAVVHLYAMSRDKSVNDCYWQLKREWEKEMSEGREFEQQVQDVMKEKNIWRYQAVDIVRREQDNALATHDT